MPQPPVLQPESYERDSDYERRSSRSGSEDEHSWQQQQEAVQPPPPAQLSVRQQAMQLLVQSTGVPSDR